MHILLITLLPVLLLSACITYSDALEAKLAGKTLAEKRTILEQECKQEIEKQQKYPTDSGARHFERMRAICEEMT